MSYASFAAKENCEVNSLRGIFVGEVLFLSMVPVAEPPGQRASLMFVKGHFL